MSTSTVNPFEKAAATSRTATPPATTPAPAAKPAPAPKAAAKPAAEPDLGFDPSPAATGDPFDLPSGGGSDDRIQDMVGMLLLCKPTEFIEGMGTTRGPSDVIRTDLVILDGDRQGELCEGVLVFQRALRRELKKILEGPKPYLVGRLEMGHAAPAQNAPYIFSTPTDEDIALVRQYLAVKTL